MTIIFKKEEEYSKKNLKMQEEDLSAENIKKRDIQSTGRMEEILSKTVKYIEEELDKCSILSRTSGEKKCRNTEPGQKHFLYIKKETTIM